MEKGVIDRATAQMLASDDHEGAVLDPDRGNLRREFELVAVLRGVEEFLNHVIKRGARDGQRPQLARDRFQSKDAVCGVKRAIKLERDVSPIDGEQSISPDLMVHHIDPNIFQRRLYSLNGGFVTGRQIQVGSSVLVGGGDGQIVPHPLVEFCFIQREGMGTARFHGQLQLGYLLSDALGCLRIGLDRERGCLFENQEQHADGDRQRDPGKKTKQAPTQP